jgi:hypothetical protein
VYVVFLSNSTSVKLKLSNGSDVLSLLVSPHSAECPEPTPALTHKTPLSFEPRHANHLESLRGTTAFAVQVHHDIERCIQRHWQLNHFLRSRMLTDPLA